MCIFIILDSTNSYGKPSNKVLTLFSSKKCPSYAMRKIHLGIFFLFLLLLFFFSLYPVSAFSFVEELNQIKALKKN